MTTPGNSASGIAPAYIDPHLAMLVRVSGRTLLFIFLLAVAAAVVPFNPRSLDWGTQFSNRIVESLSFAFVGIAFLRFASFLVPSPDPIVSPSKPCAWRANGTRPFASVGSASTHFCC